MTYKWQGIINGQIAQGIINAANTNAAIQILRHQHPHITLLQLDKQKKYFSLALSLAFKKKIKTAAITDFMQQFAFLINANIPLVASLDVINKDHRNSHLHKLIDQIKQAIESGNTLTRALQQHPQYFLPLWCNLINTGEQTGTLPTMLQHIAQHITKTTQQKRKIIKALLYPLAVLAITLVVTAIMLVLVIPRFAEMFSNFGAALPLYTQFIIKISNVVKSYGIYFFLTGIISTISCHIAKKHSIYFAHQLEKITLRLPLFGKILHKHLCIQYAQTLHITIKAGIPLSEALNITARNMPNHIYRHSLQQIQQAITHGRSLHEAMRQQKLFSSRILQLVTLGEESGNLANMFYNIAAYYAEEVNYIVDNLNNLLEPILMLILGTIVGGLIIGMYLPIFRLGNVI